jgi:phospholipase C
MVEFAPRRFRLLCGGYCTTRRAILTLALALSAGCASPAPIAQPSGPAARPDALEAHRRALGPLGSSAGKISHVVIIFQENRSTDDLFNGLPGADTVKSGLNSTGGQTTLQPVLLTAPYDLTHAHGAYEVEYDQGLMNGFNLEPGTSCKGKSCMPADQQAYGYVPQSEVAPYFAMAEQYGFGDRMFQTNEGPSFPAHQYIVSGTSTVSVGSELRAAENPYSATQQFTGGCDAPKGSLVQLIDENGEENQFAYPCFDRPALPDLVDAAGLSWRYYVAHLGPGLWNGLDAIEHIREGSEYAADVVAPSSQVLTDIADGKLANVVWVTPTAKESDHANVTNGTGPAWVASIVNAIGESSYWTNTAIFVTWDDWGGWYDHVKPPVYNSYELGFRVPLVVVSAYTNAGYVSHKQHEFGSILKFTEKNFGLGSLGTTDRRSDDLSDFFNFTQKPRTFSPIQSSLPRSYFLKQPMSMANPDDD